MTIRVGDKTIWLDPNYMGVGRPCLISRSDNGEIQVLATFVPPPGNTTMPGTVRMLRNYAFEFANSKGKLLLEALPAEQSVS